MAAERSRSNGAMFTPNDIDPMLCTHIILGFAGIAGNILERTGHNDDGAYYSSMLSHPQAVLKCQLHIMTFNRRCSSVVSDCCTAVLCSTPGNGQLCS